MALRESTTKGHKLTVLFAQCFKNLTMEKSAARIWVSQKNLKLCLATWIHTCAQQQRTRMGAGASFRQGISSQVHDSSPGDSCDHRGPVLYRYFVPRHYAGVQGLAQ